MNGSFYFTPGKTCSALRLRIIGTVYNRDLAIRIRRIRRLRHFHK